MTALRFWVEAHMKNDILKAILSDVHFWVPIVVLIVGIALLLVVK